VATRHAATGTAKRSVRGGSARCRRLRRPIDGYDAASLAGDLAALVDTLGIGPVHVVGHDIGGWVSYALTRLRPDLVRTVVVMETLLPGVDPADAPTLDVPLWHIQFHLIPDLPEALVQGREAIYFRHFLEGGTATPGVVTDDEVAHYAGAYGDPARLRAAFEVYRALPENVRFNSTATAPVDVPLLLVGGEQCFGPVMPALAAHLRDHHGWSSIKSAVVAGGRHYLPEERPDEVADLIEQHARDR
jgi:pimeloyl-ACP methyl ester carboxylesterase